jgi:hypothetical protein
MERYLSRIDRSGGPDACWPWTWGCTNKGYGALRVNGRSTYAHRFGYEQLVGPIPDGLFVRHTCDNPPCQNPAHWVVGTHIDNMADKIARDRQSRGIWHGRAKLTEDEVREIRTSSLTRAELAMYYGVSWSLIDQILRGVVWTHI